MDKKYNQRVKQLIASFVEMRTLTVTEFRDVAKQENVYKPKHCLWCGVKLGGRRTTYCSDECGNILWNHLVPDAIKARLTRDRGHKCERCGKEEELVNQVTRTRFFKIPLELHHILPLFKGGQSFAEENLILVCHDCHWDMHKEFNRENRIAEQKIRTLDKWCQ